MAKRFIDTDLFRKPFMRSLEAPYKALWIYLLCECDHAGVWVVELDVAQMRMGMKLDPAKAIEKMGGAVIPIDGGRKWYLPDFVPFQYGSLNPANRVHASALEILTRHGIDPEIKPLASPLEGAKDKDKDKENSGKNGHEAKVLFANSGLSVLESAKAQLPSLVAEGVNIEHYRKSILNWSDTKGEKRTERGWLATFRQWTDRDREKKELKMLAPVWNPRA